MIKLITIHIPKDSLHPNLRNEISSAKRIKDRQTRIDTLTGLYKIQHYL